MKATLLLFVLPVLFLTGCTDNCEQVRTYRKYTPIQLTLSDLRQAVSSGTPKTLVEPGKLYVKDQYLFIVEVKKGIHVFDNSNPSNPKAISFLSIPGNVDMAVRDNILFADSYIDLVALDISNPAAIKEVGRVETGFKAGYVGRTYWSYDQQTMKINDQLEEIATETIKTDCEGSFNVLPYLIPISWFGRYYESFAFADANYNSVSAGTKTPTGPTTGVGGSMARFAIANNQLYVVNNNALQLFDISTPSNPVKGKTANLNWNVETIFPYRNNLFIGTTTGMYIYDVTTPAEPKQLSAFSHVRSCDPVVVHENYAYVTLRGTSTCGVPGTQDVLDVINVSNPSAPRLEKSYPLETPYGLGIDFPTLFVCQGNKGLSVFDASNPLDIKPRQTFKDVNAYDVIPLSKVLLTVGKDGLYQYDYSNPSNLRLLSKIAAQQPN
ncbi:LVIVD repeat-containing protein [Spirosoma sp.]|uniref:LVIVD repeat-containing protein n=1 Tax=Spirosoma sp. TaxID=1899569 RepID=UPI003B3A65A6